MTTASNTNNNNQIALSTERIERTRQISQELRYIHKAITEFNVLDVPRAYSAAKSLANMLEGVARDCETRPSELERIDLNDGNVVVQQKRGKTTTTKRKNK
jgi:hypothetical protein